MKHHRGFTLLEIMLVMLLLGLMASYVVVNFVSESRTARIQKETDRLQQLVQVVSETAILKQQDFGLVLNNKGYQFLVHDGQKWLEVGEPKFMQFHPWPETVQAELELEGLSWAEDSILGQEEFRKLQEELLEQQEEAAEEEEKKAGKDGQTKGPAKVVTNLCCQTSIFYRPATSALSSWCWRMKLSVLFGIRCSKVNTVFR